MEAGPGACMALSGGSAPPQGTDGMWCIGTRQPRCNLMREVILCTLGAAKAEAARTSGRLMHMRFQRKRKANAWFLAQSGGAGPTTTCHVRRHDASATNRRHSPRPSRRTNLHSSTPYNGVFAPTAIPHPTRRSDEGAHRCNCRAPCPCPCPCLQTGRSYPNAFAQRVISPLKPPSKKSLPFPPCCTAVRRK